MRLFVLVAPSQLLREALHSDQDGAGGGRHGSHAAEQNPDEDLGLDHTILRQGDNANQDRESDDAEQPRQTPEPGGLPRE